MKFGIIGLFIIAMFLQGCSAGKLTANKPPVIPTGQSVNVRFDASKEQAVFARGSYRIFVGRQTGFTVADAFKTVDVAGSTVVAGKVNAAISGLDAGTYFLRIQARSDLIDPNTATAAVSELSDEITFVVQ